MVSKIYVLFLCLPLLGFSILSDSKSKFIDSSRIIISSEDLVGTKLTIGNKSMDISFDDLAKHESDRLDVLIVSVRKGSHLVSLSKFDRILFKTRVILDSGQTHKLRVRQ